MKALTLWQPYASLIAARAKRFETRDWTPPDHYIGQRIAIHAAKRTCLQAEVGDRAARAIRDAVGGYWEALPQGLVLCTAKLDAVHFVRGRDGREARVETLYRGCMETIETTILLSEQDDLFGNCGPRRFLLEFTDVRPVTPPQPARGMQKFWNWKETLHA